MSRFTVVFTRVEHDDVPSILQSGMFHSVECMNPTHYKIDPHQEHGEYESLTDVRAHSNAQDLQMLTGGLYKLRASVFIKLESITMNKADL